MTIEAQLVADITELAKRLNKFCDFYYALIEAKSVKLGIKEFTHKDSIDTIRVDKEEWERWKKVQSIINDFKAP